MENNNKQNENWRKRFTLIDYWFHFGVFVNLVVVGLLLWFGLS